MVGELYGGSARTKQEERGGFTRFAQRIMSIYLEKRGDCNPELQHSDQRSWLIAMCQDEDSRTDPGGRK